jgi:fructuronate reductase
MAVQLNSKTLGSLPGNIHKPSYDRDQVKLGVVHIGPGAFFRGHIAVYLDDILSKGDLNWGISAVSLRSESTRDKLEPQDNLYTVINQSKDGNEARVIGSIKEVLVAKDDINKVLDRMTSAETKLITLTVTQNGYYYDHKTGQLDSSHPHIKDCLDDNSDSCSTVGLLVKALETRKNNNLPPPIILSCDNFPGNGNVLRNVVLAYAGMKSEELSEWIRDNVDFPSTMVDRIVPKFVQEHYDQTRDNFGILDNWPIYTESFKEWVIEDRFRSEIPPFSWTSILT